VRSRLALVLHEGELGGANVALVRLLPWLVRRWDVVAWVPGEGATADALESGGATVTRVARPYAFSFRALLSSPGALARIRGVRRYRRLWHHWVQTHDPDVVLFNTLLVTPELADFPGRTRALRALYAHELVGRGVKARVALALARRADLHIAPSHAVATRLARAGISARVVYPGVAPFAAGASASPVASQRDTAASALDVDGVSAPQSLAISAVANRPPVVGCVGTVCPIKGTDLYLAVIDELRNRLRRRFVARLVGRPPRGRWHRWGLRVLARAAAGSVECRVPPPEADDSWSLRELADLDVLVVPSRVDACPLVVLEAMALGVPVVAFDVGGIREQLGCEGAGVLVAPGNVRALADAVAELLDRPRRRYELAARARSRQRRLFSLQRQAEALSALLAGAYERSVRSTEQCQSRRSIAAASDSLLGEQPGVAGQ